MRRDLYDFRADVVVPTDAALSGLSIDTLSGEIHFLDARSITLRSDAAQVDLGTRVITLTSGIRIDTSDGYTAEASSVTVVPAKPV